MHLLTILFRLINYKSQCLNLINGGATFAEPTLFTRQRRDSLQPVQKTHLVNFPSNLSQTNRSIIGYHRQITLLWYRANQRSFPRGRDSIQVKVNAEQGRQDGGDHVCNWMEEVSRKTSQARCLSRRRSKQLYKHIWLYFTFYFSRDFQFYLSTEILMNEGFLFICEGRRESYFECNDEGTFNGGILLIWHSAIWEF
jgi:hypothetical protein